MIKLSMPHFDSIPGLNLYLADMARAIREGDGERLSKIEANNSLLLLSPNGKVFEIKVSDTGTLSATKVYG